MKQNLRLGQVGLGCLGMSLVSISPFLKHVLLSRLRQSKIREGALYLVFPVVFIVIVLSAMFIL